MANIGKMIVTGNEFHDNAAVIREAAQGDENAEILSELRQIREQLQTTEPMIAGNIAALEQAVIKRDKPTVSALLGGFAAGSAKAVLASVASKSLLAWMGIR